MRITTPGNDFFDFEQCTVREENGKLIAESDKFTSVKEIQGDEMVDVSGFDYFYLKARESSVSHVFLPPLLSHFSRQSLLVLQLSSAEANESDQHLAPNGSLLDPLSFKQGPSGNNTMKIKLNLFMNKRK